jgi:hypothetical protein
MSLINTLSGIFPQLSLIIVSMIFSIPNVGSLGIAVKFNLTGDTNFIYFYTRRSQKIYIDINSLIVCVSRAQHENIKYNFLLLLFHLPAGNKKLPNKKHKVYNYKLPLIMPSTPRMQIPLSARRLYNN